MQVKRYEMPPRPELLVAVYGEKKLDEFVFSLFDSIHATLKRRISSYGPSKYFNEESLMGLLLERNMCLALTSYYKIENQRLQGMLERKKVSPKDLTGKIKMTEFRILN